MLRPRIAIAITLSLISVVASTLTIDTPISNAYSSISLSLTFDTPKLLACDTLRLTLPKALRASASYPETCPLPASMSYSVDPVAAIATASAPTCSSGLIIADDDSRRAAWTQCTATVLPVSATGSGPTTGTAMTLPGTWHVRSPDIEGTSFITLTLDRDATVRVVYGLSENASVPSDAPAPAPLSQVTVHCGDVRSVRGRGQSGAVDVALLRSVGDAGGNGMTPLSASTALGAQTDAEVLQSFVLQLPVTQQHALQAVAEIQAHESLDASRLTSLLSLSTAPAADTVAAFSSARQLSPQPLWGGGVPYTATVPGRLPAKVRALVHSWGDSLRENEVIRISLPEAISPNALSPASVAPAAAEEAGDSVSALPIVEDTAAVFARVANAGGYALHDGARSQCQVWAYRTNVPATATLLSDPRAVLSFAAEAWVPVRGHTRTRVSAGRVWMEYVVAEAVAAAVVDTGAAESEGERERIKSVAWKRYYARNQESTTAKIPDFKNFGNYYSEDDISDSEPTPGSFASISRPLWLECTGMRTPLLLSSSSYTTSAPTLTTALTTAASSSAALLPLTSARVSIHTSDGITLTAARTHLPRVRPSNGATTARGSVRVAPTALTTAVFEPSGRVTGLSAGQRVSIAMQLQLTDPQRLWPARGRQALVALPPGFGARVRRADGVGTVSCFPVATPGQLWTVEAVAYDGLEGDGATVVLSFTSDVSPLVAPVTITCTGLAYTATTTTAPTALPTPVAAFVVLSDVPVAGLDAHGALQWYTLSSSTTSGNPAPWSRVVVPQLTSPPQRPGWLELLGSFFPPLFLPALDSLYALFTLPQRLLPGARLITALPDALGEAVCTVDGVLTNTARLNATSIVLTVLQALAPNSPIRVQCRLRTSGAEIPSGSSSGDGTVDLTGASHLPASVQEWLWQPGEMVVLEGDEELVRVGEPHARPANMGQLQLHMTHPSPLAGGVGPLTMTVQSLNSSVAAGDVLWVTLPLQLEHSGAYDVLPEARDAALSPVHGSTSDDINDDIEDGSGSGDNAVESPSTHTECTLWHDDTLIPARTLLFGRAIGIVPDAPLPAQAPSVLPGAWHDDGHALLARGGGYVTRVECSHVRRARYTHGEVRGGSAQLWSNGTPVAVAGEWLLRSGVTVPLPSRENAGEWACAGCGVGSVSAAAMTMNVSAHLRTGDEVWLSVGVAAGAAEGGAVGVHEGAEWVPYVNTTAQGDAGAEGMLVSAATVLDAMSGPGAGGGAGGAEDAEEGGADGDGERGTESAESVPEVTLPCSLWVRVAPNTTGAFSTAAIIARVLNEMPAATGAVTDSVAAAVEEHAWTLQVGGETASLRGLGPWAVSASMATSGAVDAGDGEWLQYVPARVAAVRNATATAGVSIHVSVQAQPEPAAVALVPRLGEAQGEGLDAAPLFQYRLWCPHVRAPLASPLPTTHSCGSGSDSGGAAASGNGVLLTPVSSGDIPAHAHVLSLMIDDLSGHKLLHVDLPYASRGVTPQPLGAESLVYALQPGPGSRAGIGATLRVWGAWAGDEAVVEFPEGWGDREAAGYTSEDLGVAGSERSGEDGSEAATGSGRRTCTVGSVEAQGWVSWVCVDADGTVIHTDGNTSSGGGSGGAEAACTWRMRVHVLVPTGQAVGLGAIVANSTAPPTTSNTLSTLAITCAGIRAPLTPTAPRADARAWIIAHTHARAPPSLGEAEGEGAGSAATVATVGDVSPGPVGGTDVSSLPLRAHSHALRVAAVSTSPSVAVTHSHPTANSLGVLAVPLGAWPADTSHAQERWVRLVLPVGWGISGDSVTAQTAAAYTVISRAARGDGDMDTHASASATNAGVAVQANGSIGSGRGTVGSRSAASGSVTTNPHVICNHSDGPVHITVDGNSTILEWRYLPPTDTATTLTIMCTGVLTPPFSTFGEAVVAAGPRSGELSMSGVVSSAQVDLLQVFLQFPEISPGTIGNTGTFLKLTESGAGRMGGFSLLLAPVATVMEGGDLLLASLPVGHLATPAAACTLQVVVLAAESEGTDVDTGGSAGAVDEGDSTRSYTVLSTVPTSTYIGNPLTNGSGPNTVGVRVLGSDRVAGVGATPTGPGTNGDSGSGSDGGIVLRPLARPASRLDGLNSLPHGSPRAVGGLTLIDSVQSGHTPATVALPAAMVSVAAATTTAAGGVLRLSCSGILNPPWERAAGSASGVALYTGAGRLREGRAGVRTSGVSAGALTGVMLVASGRAGSAASADVVLGALQNGLGEGGAVQVRLPSGWDVVVASATEGGVNTLSTGSQRERTMQVRGGVRGGGSRARRLVAGRGLGLRRNARTRATATPATCTVMQRGITVTAATTATAAASAAVPARLQVSLGAGSTLTADGGPVRLVCSGVVLPTAAPSAATASATGMTTVGEGTAPLARFGVSTFDAAGRRVDYSDFGEVDLELSGTPGGDGDGGSDGGEECEAGKVKDENGECVTNDDGGGDGGEGSISLIPPGALQTLFYPWNGALTTAELALYTYAVNGVVAGLGLRGRVIRVAAVRGSDLNVEEKKQQEPQPQSHAEHEEERETQQIQTHAAALPLGGRTHVGARVRIGGGGSSVGEARVKSSVAAERGRMGALRRRRRKGGKKGSQRNGRVRRLQGVGTDASSNAANSGGSHVNGSNSSNVRSSDATAARVRGVLAARRSRTHSSSRGGRAHVASALPHSVEAAGNDNIRPRTLRVLHRAMAMRRDEQRDSEAQEADGNSLAGDAAGASSVFASPAVSSQSSEPRIGAGSESGETSDAPSNGEGGATASGNDRGNDDSDSVIRHDFDTAVGNHYYRSAAEDDVSSTPAGAIADSGTGAHEEEEEESEDDVYHEPIYYNDDEDPNAVDYITGAQTDMIAASTSSVTATSSTASASAASYSAHTAGSSDTVRASHASHASHTSYSSYGSIASMPAATVVTRDSDSCGSGSSRGAVGCDKNGSPRAGAALSVGEAAAAMPGWVILTVTHTTHIAHAAHYHLTQPACIEVDGCQSGREFSSDTSESPVDVAGAVVGDSGATARVSTGVVLRNTEMTLGHSSVRLNSGQNSHDGDIYSGNGGIIGVESSHVDVAVPVHNSVALRLGAHRRQNAMLVQSVADGSTASSATTARVGTAVSVDSGTAGGTDRSLPVASGATANTTWYLAVTTMFTEDPTANSTRSFRAHTHTHADGRVFAHQHTHEEENSSTVGNADVSVTPLGVASRSTSIGVNSLTALQRQVHARETLAATSSATTAATAALISVDGLSSSTRASARAEGSTIESMSSAYIAEQVDVVLQTMAKYILSTTTLKAFAATRAKPIDLPEHCFDGQLSGSGGAGRQETAVDCGGLCAQCVAGSRCMIDADCLSLDCTEGLCIPATKPNSAATTTVATALAMVVGGMGMLWLMGKRKDVYPVER